MELDSEWFDATLSFTDDGVLVMQEDRGENGTDDIVTVVLTRIED